VYATTATAVFGVSLHVVAYLVGQGFSEVESAFAFGITGLLSIPGMMFTGLAADRWRRPVVSTVSYSLTLIGIGALTAISFFPSGILVAVFVVTFGLSAGARGPIVMTLMAELFSGRGLASIYGAANMGQGFGAAVGTLGAGLLFDRTGSYTLGLALCALFATVGGSLFWLVPEIRGTPARDETAPPVRS
jgi:MFS family permease